MTLKNKRNLWGLLACAGLLSIVGRGAQLVLGGDIDGWHITFQLLATAVFTAIWLRYRRQYKDEEFYRRYRDDFS